MSDEPLYEDSPEWHPVWVPVWIREGVRRFTPKCNRCGTQMEGPDSIGPEGTPIAHFWKRTCSCTDLGFYAKEPYAEQLMSTGRMT